MLFISKIYLENTYLWLVGLVWFVNSYLLFQNMHLGINTWAIFGPLHFNEHPARAGQKMEHLTNHKLFSFNLMCIWSVIYLFQSKISDIWIVLFIYLLFKKGMRKKRNVGSAKIELIQWCTTLQFRHPNADILLMTERIRLF